MTSEIFPPARKKLLTVFIKGLKRMIHGKPKRAKRLLLQGTGFSGVSALRDYVREFDNVFCFMDEFDLVRHSGGLLEMSNLLPLNDLFINDSFIRRALKFVAALPYRGWDSDFCHNFQNISNRFLESFILSFTPLEDRPFTPHERIDLSTFPTTEGQLDFRKRNIDTGIYTLESVTLEEFITRAAKYIDDILTLFPQKRIALIHPMMVSAPWDVQYQFYGQQSKVILILRDPRDVYVNMMNKLKNSGPEAAYLNLYKDVDFFINDVKKTNMYLPHNIKLMKDNLLVVNFQELVVNYDRETQHINDFFGLKEKHHIAKKQFFDPSQSVKTIGIYKDFEDQEAIKKIEKELPDLCWKGEINA